MLFKVCRVMTDSVLAEASGMYAVCVCVCVPFVRMCNLQFQV
jgi:hypothetical protein